MTQTLVFSLLLKHCTMAMNKPTSAKTNLPTRQQYDEVRKEYRQQLLRSVDPTEELLSDLCAVETFKDKVADIQSAETSKVKADKILSLLSDENYEETIGPFISALHDNGQAHVAGVFVTRSNEDLLTDDKYQLLFDKLDILLDHLDPDCGIVSSLQSKRVFSQSDVERIRAQKTADEKVDKLVEILSRKSQSSYECFISELEDHDQGHIVYILTGNGSPPISDKNLNILRQRRRDMLRSMESKYTTFTSTLFSMGILTDKDRQRVEGMGPVPHQRNEKILDILYRKSERHFEMFVIALEETEQEHVAELLKDIETSGTLHMNLIHNDSLQIQDAEAKLTLNLDSDFGDSESQINRGLYDMGIVGAGVDNGCIRVWFKFLTRETLDVLERGELDKLFTDTYRGLFPDQNAVSIHIEIPETEFNRCRQIINQRKALMKPEHQKALELAAEKISDEITVDEDLLKELSLCEYRRDAILNQSTSKDKAKVLMEVMARRPNCEFQHLLNALRKKRQDAAASFITTGRPTDSLTAITRHINLNNLIRQVVVTVRLLVTFGYLNTGILYCDL